jgi:anaerobic carbon-monoxide dehydrogenase iron sulfur subunit
MTTCSMANEGYASLSAARVQVQLSPFGGTHQILLCRQCPQAACAEACPEECITRRPDGWLEIDYQRCTGCRACVEACPLDAIYWSPISGQVIKCELCGGDPQCVRVCPTEALVLRIKDEATEGGQPEESRANG